MPQTQQNSNCTFEHQMAHRHSCPGILVSWITLRLLSRYDEILSALKTEQAPIFPCHPYQISFLKTPWNLKCTIHDLKIWTSWNHFFNKFTNLKLLFLSINNESRGRELGGWDHSHPSPEGQQSERNARAWKSSLASKARRDGEKN